MGSKLGLLGKVVVVGQKCIYASAHFIAIDHYRPCTSSPSVPRRSGVTHMKHDPPVRGVGARTGIGGSYENEGVQRAIHCPKDDERICTRTHTTTIVSDYAHMAWRCSRESESQVGSGPCRAGRTRGSNRRTSGSSESSRSSRSSRNRSCRQRYGITSRLWLVLLFAHLEERIA